MKKLFWVLALTACTEGSASRSGDLDTILSKTKELGVGGELCFTTFEPERLEGRYCIQYTGHPRKQ